MAKWLNLPQDCGMQCPSCQTEISIGPGESVGFRDECDRCRADLHTCHACEFHDPSAYNECHEPNAERVLDRDRANRCEYFRPGVGSAQSTGEAKRTTEALESLFKKG